uniref:Uncharacterized protein n=1 Tax=Anguilla anguilla TaxID=7936 RepID=A0A0E9VN62_ANGAN
MEGSKTAEVFFKAESISCRDYPQGTVAYWFVSSQNSPVCSFGTT